jgi:hypothetical protein
MYDAPTRFRLFGFDSGLSGSDDVDEVAIDGGGMDVDVLLTFFWGALYACGRNGNCMCLLFSLLILQKPLRMKTRNDALLLDASLALFLVENNRIIE